MRGLSMSCVTLNVVAAGEYVSLVRADTTTSGRLNWFVVFTDAKHPYAKLIDLVDHADSIVARWSLATANPTSDSNDPAFAMLFIPCREEKTVPLFHLCESEIR